MNKTEEEAFDKAWKMTQINYSNEKAHLAFIQACYDFARLDKARKYYSTILTEKPKDPIAIKMEKEILKRISQIFASQNQRGLSNRMRSVRTGLDPAGSVILFLVIALILFLHGCFAQSLTTFSIGASLIAAIPWIWARQLDQSAWIAFAGFVAADLYFIIVESPKSLNLGSVPAAVFRLLVLGALYLYGYLYKRDPPD